MKYISGIFTIFILCAVTYSSSIPDESAVLDTLFDNLVEAEGVTTVAYDEAETVAYEEEKESLPFFNIERDDGADTTATKRTRATRVPRPTRKRVTRPATRYPTRFTKPPASLDAAPTKTVTKEPPSSVKAVSRIELVLQRIKEIQEELQQQSIQAKQSNPDQAPNTATILRAIENLQAAVTVMITDVQRSCVSNRNQVAYRDPPAAPTPAPAPAPAPILPSFPALPPNPYLDLIQNVTALQNQATQLTIDYWNSQLPPGIAIPPVVRPARLRSPLLTDPIDIQPGFEAAKNYSDKEKTEVLSTLTGLVPKMTYIENFNKENAGTQDWENFTDSVKFVADNIRNPRVSEVLGTEKIRTMLEYYDKYLEIVGSQGTKN